MTRYFYVAARSQEWNGSTTFTTEGGQYFRRMDVFSSIRDEFPYVDSYISILNVIEFSEKDYYTFIDDTEG